MKYYTITYLEYTKANYDKAHPDSLDPEYEISSWGVPCKKRRAFVHAEGIKEAWTKYMELLAYNRWKLYDFGAIIRDGIVLSSISVEDPDHPRHHYSYDGMMEGLLEVADNAQKWWQE